MKAVLIHQHGASDVLQIENTELAPPKADEVRIAQHAAGINFIDIYHRSGLYPLTLPSGLGMEAAGVVEALGSDIKDFKIGDRVAYASGPVGAYAQKRNMPASRVIALPETVTFDQAAASLLKGMTVEYLLERTFTVKAGDWVLLHAAAGGVGLLACQWLKHIGANTIGTVSTEKKAALAKQNGCKHTILYTKENWAERVHELTGGQGVAVVYDSIGKTTLLDSLKCLKPRGMLVNFGSASGKPDPFDMALLAKHHSAFLTRPSIIDYTSTRQDLLLSANRFFSLLAQGVLKVHIEKAWPLDEIASAHRALEARQTTGSHIINLASAHPELV